MYGTIAKYSVKPGSEDALTRWMEEQEERAISGWVSSTIFRSDKDAGEIWTCVVFESEAAYKKNADDPAMDKQYRALREHLREDPEWHDGHVISQGMVGQERKQSVSA